MGNSALNKAGHSIVAISRSKVLLCLKTALLYHLPKDPGEPWCMCKCLVLKNDNLPDFLKVPWVKLEIKAICVLRYKNKVLLFVCISG